MIRIQDRLIHDEAANRITQNFINDRLIVIMERVIRYGIESLNDNHWRLNSVNLEGGFPIDVSSLMTDKEFARKVSLDYLPDHFPVAKANQMFLGLYMLLKAEEQHVPRLEMEYMLFRLIREEVYLIQYADMMRLRENKVVSLVRLRGLEERPTIQRIPDQDRKVVKNAIIRFFNGFLQAERVDEEAERLLLFYEDINKYSFTCFPNTDFKLLDKMSAEEITNLSLQRQTNSHLVKDNSIIIQFPAKDTNTF